MKSQPSRFGVASRFLLYTAIAPLLLAAVLAGGLWLLGQIGLIPISG